MKTCKNKSDLEILREAAELHSTVDLCNSEIKKYEDQIADLMKSDPRGKKEEPQYCGFELSNEYEEVERQREKELMDEQVGIASRIVGTLMLACGAWTLIVILSLFLGIKPVIDFVEKNIIAGLVVPLSGGLYILLPAYFIMRHKSAKKHLKYIDEKYNSLLENAKRMDEQINLQRRKDQERNIKKIWRHTKNTKKTAKDTTER